MFIERPGQAGIHRLAIKSKSRVEVSLPSNPVKTYPDLGVAPSHPAEFHKFEIGAWRDPAPILILHSGAIGARIT